MRISDWSSDGALPIYLVAKAPEFDVVRGFVPVALAQIGIMRAAGMVAIFEEVLRLGRPARAEVDREHRLDVGGLAPVHEFVGAELVGLGRAPGEIEPDGALEIGRASCRERVGQYV